jgi:hypothetical protein
VVLDVVCIDAAFVAEARQKIAAACQCAPYAIMIAATHTHSSFGGVSRFGLDSGSARYLGEYDPALAREVQAIMVSAAARAMERMAPVRLHAGTGQATHVAMNRTRRDAPYDPAVPFVVAIDHENAVRAALFSYASHSTVLGPSNVMYSGDLIGLACRELETYWDNTTVLGLAGAAGDISTRFTRRNASLAEAARLGGMLAGAVLRASQAQVMDSPIRASQNHLQLKLKPVEDRVTLQEGLNQARQQLSSPNTNPDAPETRLLRAEIEGLEVALNASPPTRSWIETEVQVFQIGQTLIASFPGEMFVDYGLALRRALAPDHVLIAGYANDYVGYVPIPSITQGYETHMALVAPNSGPQLVAAVCALAGRNCPTQFG